MKDVKAMDLKYDPDDLGDETCESVSLAQEAQRLVLEYYGTALQSGMFAAGGEFVAAQQIGDAQIIEEADRLGLF